MAVESMRFVQAQRAREILGIDPERRLFHASFAEDMQGLDDEGTRDSAATPRAADGDVFEPAATNSQALVLFVEDERHHRPRHLVASPCHFPEGRVELRRPEPALAVFLGPLVAAPVIEERLTVGVPDSPVVLLADWPDLEALWERSIRDRVGEGADHHESVSDAVVAGCLEEADRVRLRVVCPGVERVGLVAGPIRGDVPTTLLRVLEERAPDPAPAEGGADPAFLLMNGDAVADLEVSLRSADDSAVDLGNDDVQGGIEIRPMNRIVPELVHGR